MDFCCRKRQKSEFEESNEQIDLCLIWCQSANRFNIIFIYICSHWVSNEIILFVIGSGKKIELCQSPGEISVSCSVLSVAQIGWRFGPVKKLEAIINECQLSCFGTLFGCI